jgi:peptidyl-prolyl cis-trans isomerase D
LRNIRLSIIIASCVCGLFRYPQLLIDELNPMRILLLFFCLMAILKPLYAQKDEIDLLNEFLTTTNDSIFITQYSKEPFERYRAERSVLPHQFDPLDSMIFYHRNVGEITGPYYLDSSVCYIKVTGADSSVRMHVGNLWLNPKTRGKDSCEILIQSLLAQANQNENFDDLCKLYADDHNQNRDCALAWFYEGTMVSEFQDAVIHHAKGEVLIVDTRFGKHLVKILDNPIYDRYAVEYVILYLDK